MSAIKRWIENTWELEDNIIDKLTETTGQLEKLALECGLDENGDRKWAPDHKVCNDMYALAIRINLALDIIHRAKSDWHCGDMRVN